MNDSLDVRQRSRIIGDVQMHSFNCLTGFYVNTIANIDVFKKKKKFFYAVATGTEKAI